MALRHGMAMHVLRLQHQFGAGEQRDTRKTFRRPGAVHIQSGLLEADAEERRMMPRMPGEERELFELRGL